MKKIIVKVTFILAILGFVNINSYSQIINCKPKVKFKHGGCQGASGCDCPLGICISWRFLLDGSQLTQSEREAGIGQPTVSIENGKLHMIFDCEASLEDGTIPIDNDFFIGDNVSNFFEYQSIVIVRGIYHVDFTKHREFGEVYFTIRTE